MTARLKLSGYLISVVLLAAILSSNVQGAVVEKKTLESAVRRKILDSSFASNDALNVQFVRVPDRLSIGGDSYTLLVEQRNPQRILGRLSFSVDVTTDSGNRKQCWVTADVTATTEVVVAKKRLRPRSIIGPGDITIQRKVLDSAVRHRPVTDPQRAIGKALRRGVARGRVITADLLVEAPVIKKGAAVRLQAKVGRLTVSTIGIAMKDGKEGEIIPVKNATSKKTVYGTVQKDGSVCVFINSAR